MWLEDLLQIWLALQQILRKLYSLYVKVGLNVDLNIRKQERCLMSYDIWIF